MAYLEFHQPFLIKKIKIMTQLFKIGDSVLVLDEDLSGEIKSISGSNITVLTEDGFELVFDKKELVKQDAVKSFSEHIFKNDSLQRVVSEKESKKRKTVLKKSKTENIPTSEAANKIAEKRIEDIKKIKASF